MFLEGGVESQLQNQVLPICFCILILMKVYNADAFFFFNHCFVWCYFVVSGFGIFLFPYVSCRGCIGGIAAAVTRQSIYTHTDVLFSYEISFLASKEKKAGEGCL